MRVHKGCPICQNDVLGTALTGYYCKECNLLFRKSHIRYKHMKEQVRETIRRNFSGFDIVRKEIRMSEQKEIPQEDITLSSAFQRLAPEVEEQVETMRTLRPAFEESVEEIDEPSLLVHPELFTKKKSEERVTKTPKKKPSKPAPKKATIVKPKKIAKKAARKPVKKKRVKKTVKKAAKKKATPSAKKSKTSTKKKTPESSSGLERML